MKKDLNCNFGVLRTREYVPLDIRIGTNYYIDILIYGNSTNIGVIAQYPYTGETIRRLVNTIVRFITLPYVRALNPKMDTISLSDLSIACMQLIAMPEALFAEIESGTTIEMLDDSAVDLVKAYRAKKEES